MAANSVVRLALRRSLAGKGLLAVVALGVFVAATLLASAPIYARAMADLGLTFRIREDLDSQPSTEIQFAGVGLQTAEGKALRSAVEARIDQRIGWFRLSQARFTQLGRFGIAQPGEESRSGLLQGQPQSLPGFEAHVRVVQGQLPGSSARGEPMQVALSAPSAAVAKLKPGDTFELREEFDTCERLLPVSDLSPPPAPCNPTVLVAFSFRAKVSGIIEPLNPDDPFWVNPVSQYFTPFRLQISDVGPVLPMFADERSIMESFGADYPSYRATLAWNVFADPAKLTRTNAPVAASDIGALYKDFEPLGGSAYSSLRDTLTRFSRSADYQEIPLAVLLLEISAIALFYVGLVSAVVVERQAGEIALLRSRGASLVQIGTIYLWQGLLIGIPAVLLAPFLAASATALLGTTPTFRDVSGGALLPVTIPPLSFAAGAVGVGLSLVALLLPALLVARRGTTAQRHLESRPRASVLHRYYLDLVLAAVAGLVLFELDQRGSVFEPSATGGLTSDPLLLASPALVIAAAAALLLRFYPLILRIAARLVGAAAGVSVSLGLTQVVRNSAQYTRLTLLLMMAVAVGSFAASYATTTDRSYSDRAAFETGADLRASAPGNVLLPTPAQALDKRLAAVPGILRASGVTRARAGIVSSGSIGQSYQVVGVDPTAMHQMLWWRDDFADKPLAELLSALVAPSVTPGRPLPGSPAALNIWVRGDQTLSSLTLWARLRDSEGRFATVELGEADTKGVWRELSAPVIGGFHADLVPPITLVSILMTEPPNRFNSNYTPLLVDDITVTDLNRTIAVVEDFERTLRWSAFQSRSAGQDTITVSRDVAHGGGAAGKFGFRPGASGAGGDARGIYSSEQSLPLAAVASDSFLAATGMRPGSTTTLLIGRSTMVPVTIAGTFRLFSTVPSSDGPAVILNRDQLTTWAETTAFMDAPDLVPIETMISLTPGADEKAVTEALKDPAFGFGRATSRAERLDSNRRNPLIAAGGSGILFISFAAVLMLVGAALLVTLLTSVSRRRVEFAVVRSMGASRGQIFRMLALEYSIVAVAGSAAGAVLGLAVGRQMLSFLDVTETGATVEPQFILQTQWALVGGAIGVVLVVFAAALVVATRMIAAVADAQALRTE